MAHSLGTNINKIFNLIYNNYNFKLNKELLYKFNTINGLIGLHGCFVYSTLNKDEIKVCKKYELIRDGYTGLMIIDEKNRHFSLNNSFWFWKWNSIEDWHNINENDYLRIYYYGYRIPFLGLFPVIIYNHKYNIDLVNHSIENNNEFNDYKKIFEITNWLII